MVYKIRLISKARKELSEAREWYEEKQLGLGDRFVEEVFNKTERVQNNPLHYPLKNGFREVSIDSFPFLIVYKILKTKELIYITSIFHMSRHPKRKHK